MTALPRSCILGCLRAVHLRCGGISGIACAAHAVHTCKQVLRQRGDRRSAQHGRQCTLYMYSFILQAAVLIRKTAVDDCDLVKILYFGMHESTAAVLRALEKLQESLGLCMRCTSVSTC